MSSAAYICLVEKILGKGVEVVALAAEATLKVKILGEISDKEELFTGLLQQCEAQVVTAAVRPRKGPSETQVALDQLLVADADRTDQNIHVPPEVFFKYLETKHKFRECKDPDRNKYPM